MKELKTELLITAIFVAVLILLLNPFGFFMPERLVYIMLGGIVVVFGIYLGLLLKEKPQDEREQLHRFLANRTAYFFGSIVLVSGIVYQGLTGTYIDPWLLYVLGALVISKVLSLLHSSKHK